VCDRVQKREREKGVCVWLRAAKWLLPDGIAIERKGSHWFFTCSFGAKVKTRCQEFGREKNRQFEFSLSRVVLQQFLKSSECVFRVLES